MNPNANIFMPYLKDPLTIPLTNLSKKQINILQDLVSEWTTTPTLENILGDWEKRRQLTSDMLNTTNDLSLLLLNISSLKRYLYDLFEVLNSLQVSIIVLNGTRNDVHTLKQFSRYLNNFKVFFQKGTNSFGGVLVAVHRSIPVQQVPDFQNQDNLIVLDIGSCSNKFQLATYYSPPTEKLPFNIFDDIIRRNNNSVLLGDLNAKHKSWSNSIENQKGRFLSEWLKENSFQVINKFIPTSTRSNAVIDLILTPINMSSGSFSILPSIGSDHYPVVWSSSYKIPSKDRFIPIKRTYWTLYELFITFTSTFWDNLSSIMLDKTEFFCLYERFLSLTMSRLTYVSYCKSYKPSIPPQIVELIQLKRHYLYLVRRTKHPYYILELKSLSQQIQKAMFNYKRNLWNEYCKSLNSYDVNQFWKKVNRHFSSYCPPIAGILHNGVVVTVPEKMNDIAVEFYSEQFSEHADNQSTVEIEANLVDHEIEIELQNSNLNVMDIKFNDVMKTVLALKNKNSTGLDGVSNKIIKLLPPSHLKFITSSLNYMVKNASIPQHWLTAKMILLSKTKTSIVDLNDTRPISLLPCFSKVYEKLFLVHFRQWISDNGILPDEQTGFRPGHNMATRIVSIIDQIGQGLALNTATAALFIDFKSAFNQLWIKGLWVKLKRLNCPIFIIAWLRKYLTGRSAFIEMKGVKSKCFSLFKGVPQGSCIGPVLFIVFHHDLLNAISSLHFKHLFADDLSIVLSPSANWSSKLLIPNLSRLITNVVKDLYSYSVTWKQPINFKKTYWTLFHRQISPKIPTIYCGNNIIEQVSKTKYLGVILDARLSFNHHLDYIKAKINKNISVFKRLSSCRMLSQEVSYRLYHAYIRPHYQSILNIYPALSHTKQQQLEALNRKIFRNIHRWFDATNDEITNLPAYKPIKVLTQIHFAKLLCTIIRTNPSIISDFMQHKLYLVYLREYYLNPVLQREKQAIVARGRTSNRIQELLEFNKQSLFDEVFGFRNFT
jgi:Reverse transcriptase (RNA-dependent DNA polymerase)/Endonuclease-reverse transcriptase